MDRKIEKKKWPPRRIAGFSVAGMFAVFAIYNLPLWDASSKINVDKSNYVVALAATHVKIAAGFS